MPAPPRGRLPSRPDPRELRDRPIPRTDEDETPPRGTPIPSDEELFARAMREPMPWYIALILRKLDVDAQLRQRDQRLNALEELVDAHEDALSSTKVRAVTAEQKRAKWADRLWDIAKGVLVAVLVAGLLYANSRLQCTPPPAAPPGISKESRP